MLLSQFRQFKNLQVYSIQSYRQTIDDKDALCVVIGNPEKRQHKRIQ